MFERDLTPTLKECVSTFPVTVLTGPRQSGKTTLLRYQYPDYRYITLEAPDTLTAIQADPRSFLQTDDASSIIIDEIQRLPDLLSYIQTMVDEAQTPGQFIISGSQNFLLSSHVSQTLAGRSAILELLPLSYAEYRSNTQFDDLDLWTWLYNGGYPRPYQQNLSRPIWQRSYIQTYLERDVRDLINIKDIIKFRQFLSLCAGRHGQLLNMNELGNDAGVSHTTVKEWLSLLEASYIVFRLPPYYRNFNKRIVKTPKLYFYDTGLLCQLLGIESPKHLKQHAMRGAIFEGFIITEVMKAYYNQGRQAPIYFWRDHSNNEIDLLIDQAGELSAIEIKSGQTFQPDMLKGLKNWQRFAPNSHSLLVMGGNQRPFQQHNFTIYPWHVSASTLCGYNSY